MWLNAGYVNFEGKPKVYRGREVYHMDGKGATYKSYDWIYKVRDSYQCYFDRESLKPLWFRSRTSEGGFEADYTYSFDHQANKVYAETWNSDRALRKDTLPLQPCTFDLMSIIYYARNLNFAGFREGDSIPILAYINNQIQSLYIRYQGKENVKNKDHQVYRCIKLSVMMTDGTIFKSGENLIIWMTNDKNRVPVIIEARIRVGAIKTYLKSATGLRNPQTAILKPK